MRFALFASLLFLCVAFVPGKDKLRERFVYDHEHVFTPEQVQQLDTLFRGHELRTSNEIVLVTTNSYHGWPSLYEFAASCGDSLRVGKRGKNNGMIIAFSKNLREVFMASGLGLEEAMPQARCQKFVDSLMLPPFNENRFFDGIWTGSTAVVKHLEQPDNAIK